jgi:Tfp pilus assembly protein PilZ
MAKLVERRKYRRFEIPGGKLKIMAGLGSSFIRPFLKQYPLLNMGMGGINFISTREFIKGEEHVIELNAPEEGQIQLLLRVVWTNPVPLSKDLVAGCEFFPFGDERHQNSPDAMNTLRRLYARYIKD